MASATAPKQRPVRKTPAKAAESAPAPETEPETLDATVDSAHGVGQDDLTAEDEQTHAVHNDEPDETEAAEPIEPVNLPLHQQVADYLREIDVAHVTVTYRGDKFTFPNNMDDLSGTTCDLLATNNVVAALRFMLDPARPDEGEVFSLLGNRQWALFKSRKPRRPHYLELFDLWAKADGFSAGE
ncbi:hypothetical protein [Rhodococcoides fascians]|uniref:hypothetical protein n=1 Tax=Rhodococcoides fascians TaxID=1828 RepID=UPI00050BF4DF|nr:hypothetical protein [Rhodococcus fascians]